MKLAHRSVPKQTEIHVFGIVKFKVALVAVINIMMINMLFCICLYQMIANNIFLAEKQLNSLGVVF